MTRTLTLALCLTLPSCDFFRQVGDTWQGLTHPLVALGTVLSVESPPTPGVDLEDTPYAEGTSLSLFLADASSIDEVDDAPVVGAEVFLDGVEASDTEAGLYTIGPAGGLDYEEGATWSLDLHLGPDTATADVSLPPTVVWSAPSSHAQGADLLVDASGQDFDSLLVVVLDASDQRVTWSNRPETPREIYDFTRGTTDLAVTVPGGEAFPEAGAYLVGVSGMENTGSGDLSGMNTALSTIMAGRMTMHGLPVE